MSRSYLHGPSRLGSLSKAWSLESKPQSLMGLAGGAVVRGTVVHGSMCKFGLGKLMRERLLPQNLHGKQPLMAKGHTD